MTTQSRALRSTRLLLVGTTDWLAAFADALETRAGASVRTVATADAALEAFDAQTVDAVVTAYDLPESTGVELVRSIRRETATVPVVVATASGDEAVASEAVAAGVSDYVPVDGPPGEQATELLDRTDRAVRSARRTRTQRDRARQFDAIFHDDRTATWVLDPDGTLARLNETARELGANREGDAAGNESVPNREVDATGDESVPNRESDATGGDGATRRTGASDVEALVGLPFWTLPCWSAADGIRADVRRVVETALDGRFGHAVVTRSASDDSRVVELSARPVENERGDLVSVVVEGVDITDRVDLERDLRESEELHRVTLNNMTDTVLITDEGGEYTYVCPNVHFIFGYTADEIRERGTIEDLLGDDLFDRQDLADEGVLKNIECTATDKAGREHTLLVNVREVSIQGGTLLYSCRDITKRKQRERALTALQGTARDFLYAETHQEIAQHVVDDAPSVLDLDASAVYRFDADGNDLRPAASSATMRDLSGPLSTVHADGEALPSYSFVEDETLFFDDVHETERLADRATDLRSAAFVPLGNHGVFVAGSSDVGAFDDVSRELADLLAATAEAAFDRVRRESRLREQDRELQRQNDQLTALNRINETIREIDQALVQAETREEIDHTVCELLTADDRFSFAWVGAPDRQQEAVAPRAWAGADQGYLDARPFPVDAAGVEPAGRTAATGEMTVVENVPRRLREESWRTDALSRDFLSAASIPLAYSDVTYGVLTVYAETRNAFDETAQAVLGELGETIAAAVSAIERKNALLTTSATRVEFAVDDPEFVLGRLARAAECSLTYQGGAQQTEDGSYVFVTVEDGSVDAVEAAAADLVPVDEVQQISASGTGGVVRLRLSTPFLAQELADHGAVLRRASADPASTTLVVDVPESVDVRRVTRLLEDAFVAIGLQSKQVRDRAAEHGLHSQFFEALTDRQLEVVQTAYYSGFFESPRESTGEDVADALGISPPAFYEHARTVQRKLFSTLFDEHGLPASDAAE